MMSTQPGIEMPRKVQSITPHSPPPVMTRRTTSSSGNISRRLSSGAPQDGTVPVRLVLDPDMAAGHPGGGACHEEDQHAVDDGAGAPRRMQCGDQEHDTQRADAHPLEHAQRTGHEAEHTFGVDGVAEHAEAQQRGREIDLLSSVEHGAGVYQAGNNGRRRFGGVFLSGA